MESKTPRIRISHIELTKFLGAGSVRLLLEKAAHWQVQKGMANCHNFSGFIDRLV
jgi:hypothetical protein